MELVEGDRLRSLLCKIVDQHLLAVDLGDDERVPVGQQGECRQIRHRDPGGWLHADLSFQPKLLRAKQERGLVEALAIAAEFVSQLRGICR